MCEASGYVPYTVYMATTTYMEQQPEVIQKFTNAIYKGQLWVKNHTSAEIAKVILPQFPDSDLENLTKIVERYKNQDTWKTNPVFDKEGFELIQNIMEKGGELSAPVSFQDFVITDFAKKTLNEVKE